MSPPSPLSNDVTCCLALFLTPGLGQVTYRRLMERFGDPRRVFAASDEELITVKGLRREVIGRLRKALDDPRIQKEREQAARHGVDLFCIHQDRYPPLLKEIYDPPPLLYLKGGFLPQDRFAVAVVGTRTPTSYGLEVTRRLCGDLAAFGITVVSGLARGIDGMAHQAALERGGRTFAVLGCGMDWVYPPEHAALYRSIAAQGALVSELPFGTGPIAANFPKRNRIISGLTLGTVVVEAAERSGSLITARLALEQNREVFAVPGPTRSAFSRGTNRLIKDGAKLVETVEDILEELGVPGTFRQQGTISNPHKLPTGSKVLPDLSNQERAIYSCLEGDARHVDELLRATGLDSGTLAGCLLSLEFKDLVEQRPGNIYSRKR